jgi:tetratricopeptide (TPR) repeat protein
MAKKSYTILFIVVSLFFLVVSNNSNANDNPPDNELVQLENNLAKNPEDGNANYNLAVYYYQKNDYDKTRLYLEKTLSIHPQNTEAMLLLGSVMIRLAKHDQAKTLLEKVVEMQPKNIDALNNLSLVYFLQNNSQKALEILQQSLKIDNANVGTLNNLASMYYKLQRYSDAANVYKTLIAQEPNNRLAHERLTTILFQEKKYEQIIQLLNQAKKSFKQQEFVYTQLGFAYLYMNQLDPAYQNFMQAIKINPGKAQAHYGLGLVAMKQLNLDLAVEKLEQVIRLDPSHIEAHLQLESAYEDKGDYLKAVETYKKIIAIRPPNLVEIERNYQALREKAIDYYLRKGSKAYFGEDYALAINYWQNVLFLDPENVNANRFLKTAKIRMAARVSDMNAKADSFERRNMTNDAYQEWKKVLQIDPNDPRARAGLSRGGKDPGELEKNNQRAIANMKKQGKGFLLPRDVQKPRIKKDLSMKNQYMPPTAKGSQSEQQQLYRKGIEAQSQGKFKEAIVYLERALELDPASQTIKNMLYKVKSQLREEIKAKLDRGIELANQKRINEAKELFNEVLRLDPDNPTASDYLKKFSTPGAVSVMSKEQIRKLYYEGVALYVEVKYKEAIAVWRKVLEADPEHQEAKNSINRAELELKEMNRRIGLQ